MLLLSNQPEHEVSAVQGILRKFSLANSYPRLLGMQLMFGTATSLGSTTATLVCKPYPLVNLLTISGEVVRTVLDELQGPSVSARTYNTA